MQSISGIIWEGRISRTLGWAIEVLVGAENTGKSDLSRELDGDGIMAG